MTYYILLPADTEKDTKHSANTLGEVSFGSFYPEMGMQALLSIVNNQPELLSEIKIVNDQRKEFTLTEFFDVLKDLKVRKM